jgi:hypothetical protein
MLYKNGIEDTVVNNNENLNKKILYIIIEKNIVPPNPM